MSEAVAKLPKPQLRRLLHTQIKRNLALTALSVLVSGLYMKYVFGENNKRDYAEFYRNYDIEKAFHSMRKKGLFQACDPEDD